MFESPTIAAKSATLEVRSLGKTYTGRGEPVEAIADLSFTVAPGEFVCVVGPSGAGKTTLLRILAGLLAPSKGEISVGGSLVTAPPPSARASLGRSRRRQPGR